MSGKAAVGHRRFASVSNPEPPWGKAVVAPCGMPQGGVVDPQFFVVGQRLTGRCGEVVTLFFLLILLRTSLLASPQQYLLIYFKSTIFLVSMKSPA